MFAEPLYMPHFKTNPLVFFSTLFLGGINFLSSAGYYQKLTDDLYFETKYDIDYLQEWMTVASVGLRYKRLSLGFPYDIIKKNFGCEIAFSLQF